METGPRIRANKLGPWMVLGVGRRLGEGRGRGLGRRRKAQGRGRRRGRKGRRRGRLGRRDWEGKSVQKGG